MTESDKNAQFLARMAIHHRKMVDLWCSFMMLTWFAMASGVIIALLTDPMTLLVSAAGAMLNIGFNPARRARWNQLESNIYASKQAMARDMIRF